MANPHSAFHTLAGIIVTIAIVAESDRVDIARRLHLMVGPTQQMEILEFRRSTLFRVIMIEFLDMVRFRLAAARASASGDGAFRTPQP
jgi:hypothetical protein